MFLIAIPKRGHVGDPIPAFLLNRDHQSRFLHLALDSRFVELRFKITPEKARAYVLSRTLDQHFPTTVTAHLTKNIQF